jgi:CRP-like cAMP-binding protein
LKFFQSLKKENESEDIIYQCCKELKYRKYEPGKKICKYGEEGDEFYVIIKGSVDIYTPKHIEVNLSI